MTGLTTALLARACRIFLTLAYPGGKETIPEKKRPYLDLPLDQDVEAFLPPAALAHGIAQVLKGENGKVRGYAFRLGSAIFPHLKLQVTAYNEHQTCVFGVDTHDAFHRTEGVLTLDHPEYEAWTLLQQKNRKLKEQIERAWEKEGLWTFNRLLQAGLDAPVPSS
jgi:hypothetical protein